VLRLCSFLESSANSSTTLANAYRSSGDILSEAGDSLIRAPKNKGKTLRGMGAGPVPPGCRGLLLALVVGFLIPGSAMPQTKRVKETKESPSTSPLTAREIAKKALESVVLLVTEDANGKAMTLGSGFQVGSGIIATNYHVIKDASRVYASFHGGNPKFEILGTLAVDEKNDLALLRLGRVVAAEDPYDEIVGLAVALPLATGSSPTEVGDTVYVVGNPEGLEGTFSEGIVSALRNDYIQITAPISHGSSGGPVMDRYGKVIGVATAFISEGQNLNFAIPVTKLLPLMRNLSAVTPLAPHPSSRLYSWSPPDKASLRGIKRIQVLIEHLDSDVESLGLTTNRIQTDTEIRLRRAGIPLTPWAGAEDEGTLYINVNTKKVSEAELYAFSLSVEIRQEVNLKRNPSVAFDVPTWSAYAVGTCGIDRLSQIRDAIGDFVDRFVNTYLEMNPKK